MRVSFLNSRHFPPHSHDGIFERFEGHWREIRANSTASPPCSSLVIRAQEFTERVAIVFSSDELWGLSLVERVVIYECQSLAIVHQKFGSQM